MPIRPAIVIISTLCLAACSATARITVPPDAALIRSEPHEPTKHPVLYAIVWRAHQDDATFDTAEFERRIPRLREWLDELHRQGKLAACGGGGFRDRSGGLTIVRAKDADEALALAAGSPLNEIGSSELLVWDVFFASLHVPRHTAAP